MKEYISREAVCLTDFEIAMCNGDYKELCKMILDKIANAPTADVRPRWIPVSERLPVPRTKVLVAYQRGVTIAERDGYVIDPKIRKTYWRGVHGPKHSLASVTHWMPLPEPPKEE